MALTDARIDHLVLDFDTQTNEELVTVNPNLVKKLKPHQVKGVKFMWDASFESIERIAKHPGSGCVLAHCMGLGKSLQVVTLVHTVLSNPRCQVLKNYIIRLFVCLKQFFCSNSFFKYFFFFKMKRVLVVCPLSTVLNWENEFKTWLPGNLALDVYELTNAKGMKARLKLLTRWFDKGGVLLIGYDMYRSLTYQKAKDGKVKKSQSDSQIIIRALVTFKNVNNLQYLNQYPY